VTPPFRLGPLVRRYRTTVPILPALGYLSLGPLTVIVLVVSAVAFDRPSALAALPLGLVLILFGVLFVLWSGSAYLDVHRKGVVIGRRVLGGEPRAMWFTEIHPATIRVFSRIDDIRPLRAGAARMISTHWHFAAGADLAVTFLGPDRDTSFTAQLRRPAPGPGIVVFGSREATEIAAALRAGLERGGCPPHLARWSEQFGTQELKGLGRRAQRHIPGFGTDWTP